MPIALIYHDVVPREQADASGFPGGPAAWYKLTPDEFRDHLAALARETRTPPGLATDLLSGAASPWMLTFDDGGRSAHALIADLLEQRGWRGHFFITTNHIGAPSFVTVEQIRDLDRRGHIVGSHSCSHPARMSACSAEEVLAEWQRSAAVLADVLGKAVPVASVPGGFYSRAVAHAAAQAGFRFLFTSEPTASWHRVDGCLVLGRYSIDRGTSATIAAALASGRCLPRWRQSLLWNVKKVAKAVGGRGYAGLRRWLLTRAHARDSSRVRPT